MCTTRLRSGGRSTHSGVPPPPPTHTQSQGGRAGGPPTAHLGVHAVPKLGGEAEHLRAVPCARELGTRGSHLLR